MSDKTRHAIAARLAANRKATGVAIRAPKPTPKKATKTTKAKPVEVVEPLVETIEEEQGGTEG